MSIEWIGRLPLDRSWLRAAVDRSRALARIELGAAPDETVYQCGVCRDPFLRPANPPPGPLSTCGRAECLQTLASWARERAAALRQGRAA